MKALVATAAAVAVALASACTAHADPPPLVPDNGGNHSVSVSIVNGVATVVVDGRQLYGEEAQPYIDAAKAKARASGKSVG